MKRNKIFTFIQIDYYAATPKYLQLANGFIRAIKEGILKENEVVPSINEVSFEYDISRDTAEKGYRYLKKNGIIDSVHGKGYFVKKVDLKQQFNILLLFNKLSSHKKIVYDSFVKALNDMASVDLYIYNNDFHLFKKILENAKKDYTHYVIIPHFLENAPKAYKLIDELPKGKLILMDYFINSISGEFGCVFEDFEQDILNALLEANEQLMKYEMLKLVFPEQTYYPQEIMDGFIKFCKQYAYTYEVIDSIVNEPIKEGNFYIVLTENDLVALVEKILCTKLKIGKHIGIISYNETALKKVVLNGITTISTDFHIMGAKTAQLILNNSKEHYKVPFYLTKRQSI